MRYLVVTALALLSWSWAQQYVSPRQTRVFKRNPQIEAITRNAQWVRINLDEGLSPGSQPQRRITSTDFGAASAGYCPPKTPIRYLLPPTHFQISPETPSSPMAQGRI
jgi:hypothetical protein